MIDDLKPYPAMKDSGVPWLGEVPEHWGIQRGKWLFRTKKEINSDLRNANVLSLTLRGVVNNDPDAPEGLVPKDYGTYQLFSKGDLVFKLIDLENLRTSRVGLVNEDGIMSPAYIRLIQAHGGQQRYFHHQYFDLYQRGVFNQLGAGVRSTLSAANLMEIPVATPPPAEQAAIVRFLDYMDRRIRRYIRAKQKLIKLLEEQKQAIIHRAVTRGLDPNVRLKPSGVEWLGDVPEHWEVLPLCAIARPRKQANVPHRELLSVYLGRGVIPFTAVTQKRTNPTSEDLSKYQTVEPGDFVLNNQQAWRGSVGVSRYQGIVSPAYLVLALDGRLLVEFADWLLPGRAMVTQYLVSSKGVGSIQRNLYWPHLRRVAVPLPPLFEQEAIARLLDSATASLTTMTERTRCEIDLLREYRTRLMADVVTGKLDVREAAARLPEETDAPEPPDEVEDDTEESGAGENNAVSEEEAEA